MSSQLDPSILAAITEEARQCFLDEDAPEYLAMLESGLKERDRPDFTTLLRAAHSLKGGAGLASLENLQHLAHKLEDILVDIQQGKISEVDLGWALVERSINEVAFMLSQARTTGDVPVDWELITALEEIAKDVSAADIEADDGFSEDDADSDLVRTALTQDLEATWKSIEELSADAPASSVAEILADFADECQFLSETLELPWLGEASASINSALENFSVTEVLELAREIVGDLRSRRDAYLNISEIDDTTGEDGLVAHTLNQDLEASLAAIEELSVDMPLSLIQQFTANFSDECSFWGETLDLPWLVTAVAPLETITVEAEPEAAIAVVRDVLDEIRNLRDLYLQDPSSIAVESLPATEALTDSDEETVDLRSATAPETNIKPSKAVAELRIPVVKLETITNNVEELILIQSRLNRQQKLLSQANRRLRSLNRQFEPIREQIQNLYDRLAVSSTNSKMDSGEPKQVETRAAADFTFDSLELDRYTELHTSLQSFQELMLLVQETRTDIDLIERELADDLEYSQKNLDTLYHSINESRLVPFQLLAQRFIPQIESLNRRFEKSVDLEIIGENTFIDRLLLEQLQTPLTHLINNACDHGIESKAERLVNNKPATAGIMLKATQDSDRLVLTIQDDGRGINLEKVYQRAVERGICTGDRSIDQFSHEEIINWIFEPDFSTAAQVSNISGRGMGLDIVRSQIRQLKGDIRVRTKPGEGTTFTINLPLNLNWRSLLLVQLQNRIIAIPNISVIEALLYEELEFVHTDTELETIRWQKQTIPFYSLASLLPCPRQPLRLNRSGVAIVTETAVGLSAILVDGLLREERLIVKPFDDTIPIPSYLAGCTVLASGEVIPVILPQGLQATSAGETEVAKTASKGNTANKPTILVAEDSVATRRMLEKVLTAVGYQVIMCRDGQEALDRIERDRTTIDLIISDIEMPRVNGFELLQKVRSNGIYKTTPVIMATSRTGDRHRQQAMKLGATDYLGKPIQPQELLTTIEAWLTSDISSSLTVYS